MEVEETTPTPEYIKGFNEGYIINKHMPELATQLEKAVGETQRGNGFRDGKAQSLSELKESLYPSWLKKDHLSNIEKSENKSKGKDLDKDGIEPEL